MTCHRCRAECRKFGKRQNRQRYQCQQCRKVFTDARDNTLDGMYLPIEKAELVLKLLLEGNSVSSVVRLTEVHQKTVLKLLLLAGEKAERIMAQKIRNVPVTEIQADEVWQFVGCKQRRKGPEHDPTWGDSWTYVALDPISKLVVNVTIGNRDQQTTNVFLEGLWLATSGNFQLTTDGFAPYRTGVLNTLEDRVDFAMLIKVYRATPEGERRYSPAEVVSTEVVPICGIPDPQRICTSHVERSNLSLRLGVKRFARLTLGFSKSFRNHCAAVMLWYCWYNFGRVHKTLRVTPAMQAGISDHVWTVRELLEAA